MSTFFIFGGVLGFGTSIIGMIWCLIVKVKKIPVLLLFTVLSIVSFVFGMELLEKAGASMGWMMLSVIVVIAEVLYLKSCYVKSTPDRQRAYENEQESKRNRKSQAKDARIKARTIVRATIISAGSKANTSSAIGRAIIGDFIAGGVGSVVGASTAKQDGTTKFLVEYQDGHKAMETVKDNSLRFQELMSYVEM